MTATDPALVAALARLIVLHRETYFNDADAIAERHDMTPEAVAECIGWFKTTVEPRYRGTAILAAASELATRMRHGPPIMAAAERRPEASRRGRRKAPCRSGRPGSSPTRLRPVWRTVSADHAAAAIVPGLLFRRWPRRPREHDPTIEPGHAKMKGANLAPFDHPGSESAVR